MSVYTEEYYEGVTSVNWKCCFLIEIQVHGYLDNIWVVEKYFQTTGERLNQFFQHQYELLLQTWLLPRLENKNIIIIIDTWLFTCYIESFINQRNSWKRSFGLEKVRNDLLRDSSFFINLPE